MEISTDQNQLSGVWSRDALWVTDTLPEAALFLDGERRLIHANPAARSLACAFDDGGRPYVLLDLVPEQAWQLLAEEGSWLGTVAFNDVQLHCSLRRMRGGDGRIMASFFEKDSQDDARDLQRRHHALETAYRQLAGTQEQLLHSEKLASIGQLAAGVAHEINNPIGYVHSNLATLQEYTEGIVAMLGDYAAAVSSAPAEQVAALAQARQTHDIDFIISDLPQLMTESREGIERVIRIVQDLKELSRVDRDKQMRPADVLKGLESTLNIVWNDLKYKARIERLLTELPPVECHLSEINQVFMNLLINAGHAIEGQGVITLGSGVNESEVWVSVSDNGIGIGEEHLRSIFDPFFTTKPAGRGTGLGLAIVRSIMDKHHGRVEVSSDPGQGSTFRVVLPLVQPDAG
ncbi:MAG: ATP-binding protein [Pseudomonadota bacterium]|nr:ATP-binding protein [Pseudomonadota bacterium]